MNEKMAESRAREFFRRFSEQSVRDAFELVAEDCEWTITGTLPISGTYSKQEFLEFWESSVVDHFTGQGIQLEVVDAFATGNRVAVEATSYAPLVDGGTYENQYVFLLTVEEGLLRSVREYSDTKTVHDIFC